MDSSVVGSYIAKAPAVESPHELSRIIQLASRNPDRLYNDLQSEIRKEKLFAVPAEAGQFRERAGVAVSLVGIMHGTPDIQWKGAANVAEAAKTNGAKFVHISAIETDERSSSLYTRMKALGEKAVEICPDATIIHPSLVFGPGDGFFAVSPEAFFSGYDCVRQNYLLSVIFHVVQIPPVFGGGTTLFQPVYAGDIARPSR